MSDQFAPTTIAESKPMASDLKGLVGYKSKSGVKLTYEQIKNIVSNALELAIENAIRRIESEVKRMVPRASGDLMADIIANIESSRVTGFKAILRFGTSIDYAGYVNAMPTSSLRHTGQVGYTKYGKTTLYDPQAQSQFLNFLWMNFIKYFKQELKAALQAYTAAVGQQYGAYASVVKVVET